MRPRPIRVKPNRPCASTMGASRRAILVWGNIEAAVSRDSFTRRRDGRGRAIGSRDPFMHSLHNTRPTDILRARTP